jgi:hypothetical protein
MNSIVFAEAYASGISGGIGLGEFSGFRELSLGGGSATSILEVIGVSINSSDTGIFAGAVS